MKRLFFANLLALAALASPARAQDIGNVALRTVSATVANGVTCTGAAQNFRTSQGIAQFQNLGQTSHLATASSNAATFQMEIDGIDNLGNVFRLSDLQVGVPTSAKGGLVVTASGYMTNIQISVTCSAGATFSVSYSGSFSPQPPNIAGTLLAAADKLPFQTAPANATASTTFQAPNGNSAGTIVFQYSAAGPAGSTITVQCITNAGTNLNTYQFSLATPNTPQFFNIASSNCPFVTTTYTTGGASAATYTLEYIFSPSGAAGNSDPCAATTQKSSIPINISAATTTQLVALSGSTTISVCSFVFGARSTGGTAVPSVTFEYGTGASCGTGTTALTGAFYSADPPTVTPSPGYQGTLFKTAPGNALCALTAGTTITVQGVLVYVQQ
jgi:hypothetical protein